MQRLASTAVASIVEAIAAERGRTPAFATSAHSEEPALVPRATQDALTAAARFLLQSYVQRHAQPLAAIVSAAFSCTSFTSMDAAAVSAARPFCSTLAEQLTTIATEAASLLPGGESLPPGLVRTRIILESLPCIRCCVCAPPAA